jgi:hypothetical protein
VTPNAGDGGDNKTPHKCGYTKKFRRFRRFR